MSREPTPTLLEEVARAIWDDANAQYVRAGEAPLAWYDAKEHERARALARAACAVIARRLREAMKRGAALPASSEAKAAMMLTLVSALIEKLEKP